ncbi:nuclear transport factor 2 family protein [Streptomyces sp. NPDC005012]|uniref:nuclear transport factor 2 family protein n=1 Tax=Streptomyces sp. NPDC005012 TaxID=3154558 RepID=UPI0033A70044
MTNDSDTRSERRDELRDRLEITEMAQRCALLADYGPADEWAGLFTENGSWNMPDSHIRAHGRAELKNLARVFLDMAPGLHRVQSNLVITLNGDTATGWCEMNEFLNTPSGPLATIQGRFRDEYKRTGERWLIASRTFVPADGGTQGLREGPAAPVFRPLLTRLTELFEDKKGPNREHL